MKIQQCMLRADAHGGGEPRVIFPKQSGKNHFREGTGGVRVRAGACEMGGFGGVLAEERVGRGGKDSEYGQLAVRVFLQKESEDGVVAEGARGFRRFFFVSCKILRQVYGLMRRPSREQVLKQGRGTEVQSLGYGVKQGQFTYRNGGKAMVWAQIPIHWRIW